MRLGVLAGEACKGLLDSKMKGLNCERIEVDDMWGFVGMKQKTANRIQTEGFGDIWTWIAIDADSKIVPVFAIRDRSGQMADKFISDLAWRLNNRVQISDWRPRTAPPPTAPPAAAG